MILFGLRAEVGKGGFINRRAKKDMKLCPFSNRSEKSIIIVNCQCTSFVFAFLRSWGLLIGVGGKLQGERHLAAEVVLALCRPRITTDA